MEILKLLFYILVFPGFLYSSMIGMLMLGIVENLLAGIQKRVRPHVFQYFYDFYNLIKKVKIIHLTSDEKIFLACEIIGLISLTAAVLFIPIFNFSPFTGESDMVAILYLLMVPTIAVLTCKAITWSGHREMNISREIIEIFSYEMPFIIILLIIGEKAGLTVNNGIVTFSFKKIIEFQAGNGSMITNWSMIPAMLGMLMIVSFKAQNHASFESEAETKAFQEKQYENPIMQIISKVNHSIRIYTITSLFASLFLSGKGTGIIVADTLIQILLSMAVGIISISLFSNIPVIIKLKQKLKYSKYYPTILALVSLILVFRGF